MSSTFNLERTLAIIKPGAICHRFAIMRRIKMAGFHVLDVRKVENKTINMIVNLLFFPGAFCKIILGTSNRIFKTQILCI